MSTYVLVVESSNKSRMSIVNLLENFGISNVVEASDAQQAIDQFKKGQFDLILADWNLPNGQGSKIVREIRHADKSVPIIVTTTQAEPKELQQATQAGANGYIVKPFSDDELREALDKYMSAATR